MALSGIQQGRVVALFSPTPGQPGFLQPLLAGPQGDNQSYVQIIAANGRIEGFLAVPWPERDVVLLGEEHVVEAGNHSFWAFAFPGEAPQLLPWPTFRQAMSARITQGALAEHPLLAFDLVDTLDLAQAKRETFSRAYRSYQAIDRTAATRWRDRAILEPALRKVLATAQSQLDASTNATARIAASFRARLNDERLIVTIEGFATGIAAQLRDAYHQLAADFPELFVENITLDMEEPRDTSPARGKPPAITLVLVGRIQTSFVDRERWRAMGVEVVALNHHRPERRPPRPDSMTMLLGVQSEWRELTEAGERMDYDNTMIVSLSTSVTPLIRDLEFQASTRLPTISFFAPFATSAIFRRDPIQLIAPLLDIFTTCNRRGHLSRTAFSAARHRLLMREPVRKGSDPITTACRLAARAIRAGAVVHGGGELYGQHVSEETVDTCRELLAPLFDLIEPIWETQIDKRQPALLLLVERVHRYRESVDHRETLIESLAGLLKLRGWEIVERHEHFLVIGTATRRFSITLVDGSHRGPDEDPSVPTPGLGRSPFVVVHVQPRREELLVGNRGQYLHLAIEDIARMVPETAWIWPVLRRQLLESSARPTLAALRLSTALVVEAIRSNRLSAERSEWNEVESMFAGPDSERFVDFIDNGIGSSHALLRTSVTDARAPGGRRQVLLELRIEDDGPVVMIID